MRDDRTHQEVEVLESVTNGVYVGRRERKVRGEGAGLS